MHRTIRVEQSLTDEEVIEFKLDIRNAQSATEQITVFRLPKSAAYELWAKMTLINAVGGFDSKVIKVQKAIEKVNRMLDADNFKIITEYGVHYRVHLLMRIQGSRPIEDGSKVSITEDQILDLAKDI